MMAQTYEKLINESIKGLLNTELSELTRDEEHHLEKEFEGYDKLYPRR